MSSLPVILTPAFLSSIRNHPNLPRHTWTRCNTTLEIAVSDHDEKLRISRRMREALIKAAAVGGVPRTINALTELRKVTPDELLDEPESFSPTGRRADIYETPAPQIMERGQNFFPTIYGKVTNRVMNQMDRSGTEDLGLIARLTYGYVLSNTSVLSAAETSFVMIAGLIPQDVNPQLKGHLKGALNSGATADQVKAVRDVAVEICVASGMKMLDNSSPAGFGWRSEVADL